MFWTNLNIFVLVRFNLRTVACQKNLLKYLLRIYMYFIDVQRFSIVVLIISGLINYNEVLKLSNYYVVWIEFTTVKQWNGFFWRVDGWSIAFCCVLCDFVCVTVFYNPIYAPAPWLLPHVTTFAYEIGYTVFFWQCRLHQKVHGKS